MSDGPEEMVTFRLAPRDRLAIQRLIEAGEFRNRSDFLRYAVKATLAEHEDRGRGASAKLDLDMEGVELPSNAATKAKARPRAGKGVNL